MKVNDTPKAGTYMLDSSGKLLDGFGYYLLDEKNEPILLEAEHLEKLKQFEILKWIIWYI